MADRGLGGSRRLTLPRALDDIDAAFMTTLLRSIGVITETNAVVSLDESGVGMTAGYFSSTKRIRCTYLDPADAPHSFVAKAWPAFEALPHASIAGMFIKDISAYHLPANRFYPHPRAFLADFDAAADRWGLVMDDADTFSEQRVHEHEMTLDDVLRMVPKLVDVAVAWEGCDDGPKAEALGGLGVDLWASDTNLGLLKEVMPRGARLYDKLTTLEGSSLVPGPRWDAYLGGPGTAELLTRRLDAFFAPAHPARGATCTLSHGDLRGDNIFFCEANPDFPDDWLCIDFQLMFRGPVPSDLAYLMTSGTVAPDVYTDCLQAVMEAFYEQFMTKTTVYRQYTYDAFVREFAMMTTVLFVYAVRATIWQAAAFRNAGGARVELGDQGATEADLTAGERRQRMWWRKSIANIREAFKTFGLHDELQRLPDSLDGLAPWVELPPHLR